MQANYDKYGRLKYTPELHGKHKQPWTNKDEAYLVEHYVSHGPEHCSLALERPLTAVMERACKLRKQNKMPPRQKGAPKHRRLNNADD